MGVKPCAPWPRPYCRITYKKGAVGMNENTFMAVLVAIALIFTLFFSFTVLPALAVDGNVLAAFAAGFVNPYAAGYATDVILCWAILAVWVLHERRSLGLRHGGLCLLLGVVPGVAVGFALYLVLRTRQLRDRASSAASAHGPSGNAKP